VQVCARVITCLWALAVMREWKHPLLRQLLLIVSSMTAPDAAMTLPREAGMQLGQFLLLASAEGLLPLVATVPDGLRVFCLAMCERALPPVILRKPKNPHLSDQITK
jgi:hypothetical protein